MEFKVHLNKTFAFRISMAVIWLGLGILNLFSPPSPEHVFRFNGLLEIITGILWFTTIWRLFFFSLLKKPILVVNEIYIYDFQFDVKYYWNDIKEFYGKDIITHETYLYINLFHPEEYLANIGNPLRRIIIKLQFKPDRKKSQFVINLNNIETDANELLDILNDYSIKAINNEIIIK